MLLSKSFLRSEYNRQASNDTRFDSNTFERRTLNENASIYRIKSGYDIFLSHSSMDKEIVIALVSLFNRHNYSTYVDWIDDPQLNRNNVTTATANTLKTRMKQSKGLSYIPTGNSTQSKWCPWELGYFDGLKKEKCTILPVLNENDYTDKYNGQEYLGLYLYVIYDRTDFYVRDSAGTCHILLRDWLPS